jgi:hypothetical protein
MVSPPGFSPRARRNGIGSAGVADVEREMKGAVGIAPIDAIVPLGRAPVALAALRRETADAERHGVPAQRPLVGIECEPVIGLLDDDAIGLGLDRGGGALGRNGNRSGTQGQRRHRQKEAESRQVNLHCHHVGAAAAGAILDHDRGGNWAGGAVFERRED